MQLRWIRIDEKLKWITPALSHTLHVLCLFVCTSYSTTEKLLQRLWARVGSSENGFLRGSKQGSDFARQGNSAFICEEPFGHYLSTVPPCQLKTTESFLITEEARTYNFAFKMDESLKQNISAISTIVEKLDKNGRLQDLYDKSFRGGVCSGCVISLSFSLIFATLFLTVSKLL